MFSFLFHFLCILIFFKDISFNIHFFQFYQRVLFFLKPGNVTVHGLLIFPKLLTVCEMYRSIQWVIKPSQLYLLLAHRWDFVCTGFVDLESCPGLLTETNLNIAAKNLKLKQHWQILDCLKCIFCCKKVKLHCQESPFNSVWWDL